MKKMFYFFIAVAAVIMTSCAKEPITENEPVNTNGTFTLVATNATRISGDTVYIPVNELLYVYVTDKNGQKIAAEFDFGNGNSKITGDQAADKYVTKGVYRLTASIKSVTPNVTLSCLVNAFADVVTPSGETAIVLINGNLSGTTNSMVVGLRCDIINSFNAGINGEVQGELPNVTWKAYTLKASEIVTIAGIKYFKWSFSSVNGKVRFGWLQGSQWAYDPNSIYRQSDGLYVFYLKNGKIYTTDSN